jgi:aryl-alcohol dehydrogenase-like predicted oxidoreductase
VQSINKIVLGTVQLGLNYGINNTLGKPESEKAVDILLYAYESGIRTLDTADAYGDSQSVIGEYHRQYSDKKFNVISKFKANSLTGSLTDKIKQDINKMSVDYLDGYMFHDYNDYYNGDEYINELVFNKKAGLIKKIGVSIYTNEQIEKVSNDSRIDFIQLPYNLLDNNSIRGELISRAKKNRKEIHIRSVFLQGLLFMDREKIPQNLQRLKPYLLKIDAIAAKQNLQMEALALNYVEHNNDIDFILIGVDSKEQLSKSLLIIGTEKNRNIYDEIDNIRVKEVELLNPVNW